MLRGARAGRWTPCSCFDIDDEEIVRRLAGRTVCESCQTPYTGREPGAQVRQVTAGRSSAARTTSPTRSATGSPCTSGRRRRCSQWYREHGTRVAVIDAVGSVQDVTARALGALASLASGEDGRDPAQVARARST